MNLCLKHQLICIWRVLINFVFDVLEYIMQKLLTCALKSATLICQHIDSMRICCFYIIELAQGWIRIFNKYCLQCVERYNAGVFNLYTGKCHVDMPTNRQHANLLFLYYRACSRLHFQCGIINFADMDLACIEHIIKGMFGSKWESKIGMVRNEIRNDESLINLLGS